MEHRPLLIVAGATASGKSALALRLAARLDGEIINADSVQVYRGADIGSAKAVAAERKLIRHHLLDICEPTEQYNVARFISDAQRAAEDIASRGKRAVLCGGTTLYIKHLLYGLAQIPEGSAAVRAGLEPLSNAELYSELERIDPARAQELHPNDRLRVMRALEVALSGGVLPSAAHADHGSRKLLHSAVILLVCRPRAELYRRIDRRVQAMLDAGLIDECRRLCSEFGAGLPLLKTLGYAQGLEYLQGKLSERELAPAVATATRQYAKRQLTFWRNEPAKCGWHFTPDQPERAAAKSGAKSEEFAVLRAGLSEIGKIAVKRMETPPDSAVRRVEVICLDGEGCELD